MFVKVSEFAEKRGLSTSRVYELVRKGQLQNWGLPEMIIVDDCAKIKKGVNGRPKKKGK